MKPSGILNNVQSAYTAYANSLNRISGGVKTQSSLAPADITIAVRLKSTASDALHQARNLQDQISSLQMREQLLGSTIDRLNSLRDLAIASQNGTLPQEGVQAIRTEASAHLDSITDAASGTFNGAPAAQDASLEALGLKDIDIFAENALTRIDSALSKATEMLTTTGASISSHSAEIDALATMRTNAAAAFDTIATADIAEESTLLASSRYAMMLGTEVLKAHQNIDALRASILLDMVR